MFCAVRFNVRIRINRDKKVLNIIRVFYLSELGANLQIIVSINPRKRIGYSC
jgi:hypothetical protein